MFHNLALIYLLPHPKKILATDKSNYKKMSTGATTEKHTKKLKI